MPVNAPGYQGLYFPQAIQTTGTTVINFGQQVVATPPAPEPEPGPLDWLRSQVDEIRELALVA